MLADLEHLVHDLHDTVAVGTVLLSGFLRPSEDQQLLFTDEFLTAQSIDPALLGHILDLLELSIEFKHGVGRVLYQSLKHLWLLQGIKPFLLLS